MSTCIILEIEELAYSSSQNGKELSRRRKNIALGKFKMPELFENSLCQVCIEIHSSPYSQNKTEMSLSTKCRRLNSPYVECWTMKRISLTYQRNYLYVVNWIGFKTAAVPFDYLNFHWSSDNICYPSNLSCSKKGVSSKNLNYFILFYDE